MDKVFFHRSKSLTCYRWIRQGLPVSAIIFLIYISGVFDKVAESNLAITSLSLMKNLGSITSRYSAKEIVKALEKVVKVVLVIREKVTRLHMI